jgi:tetratricopeptide (TPR) repeat protein
MCAQVLAVFVPGPTFLRVVLIVGFPHGMRQPPGRGELQYGRQALLEGKNEAALGYFQSAAQKDTNYVYATGSSPKQSVWSYVGRSEYLTGRFPEARKNLERALASNQQEDIARLYLGLTLAREGDRQRGLKEIEGGMRGIDNFLGYISQAQ